MLFWEASFHSLSSNIYYSPPAIHIRVSRRNRSKSFLLEQKFVVPEYHQTPFISFYSTVCLSVDLQGTLERDQGALRFFLPALAMGCSAERIRRLLLVGGVRRGTIRVHKTLHDSVTMIVARTEL